MTAEAQTVRIPEVGFRMTLPPRYEIQSLEAVRQNRAKAGMGAIADDATLPVLCAMRPPDDPRNVMPTIQIVYRANVGAPAASLDRALEAVTLAQSDVFEEFDYVELPAVVAQDGAFGIARCAARYLLGYNRNHPLWVHVRFWLVVRDADMFMVTMSGGLEEEHLFAAEFETAFASADFRREPTG